MSITRDYLKDYIDEGTKFHGHLSPGLIIGIFMVDMAKELLGPRNLIDAVVETKLCLPDAIQIMTPCSYGNGWMKVKDWGKFALALFDKEKLDGIRVYLDLEKVKDYPRIHQWYMRHGGVTNKEITSDILDAERNIYSWERIIVSLPPKEKGPVSVCTLCGETYPANDSKLCIRCNNTDNYYQVTDGITA